jgi:hypothetical protein
MLQSLSKETEPTSWGEITLPLQTLFVLFFFQSNFGVFCIRIVGTIKNPVVCRHAIRLRWELPDSRR